QRNVIARQRLPHRLPAGLARAWCPPPPLRQSLNHLIRGRAMTHSSSRSPSALRSRFRPLLEGLEDRTVPTILVVDPAGGPGLFPTIQAAVNAANPAGGDTIQIHPATYAEQVTINKSLTMLGTAPGVTIKAPATLTPDPVFALRVLVEVDNAAVVDLSSLTISGPAPLINAGLLIVGRAAANLARL